MANSTLLPELRKDSDDDVFELNKDLERMIEDVENISVQLSWMAYDMVALRTNPVVGASMRNLEEAYQKCRAAMESREKMTDQAYSIACIDLENILKRMESLSNCMDQLTMRTQLRHCDLIVCVGCPEKLAILKNPSDKEPRTQQPPF